MVPAFSVNFQAFTPNSALPLLAPTVTSTAAVPLAAASSCPLLFVRAFAGTLARRFCLWFFARPSALAPATTFPPLLVPTPLLVISNPLLCVLVFGVSLCRRCLDLVLDLTGLDLRYLVAWTCRPSAGFLPLRAASRTSCAVLVRLTRLLLRLEAGINILFL